MNLTKRLNFVPLLMPLIVGLFLFQTKISMAQQSSSGLSVVVKTGISSGCFTTQKLMEVSSEKNSYLAGLGVNYQVMEMLSVSGELLFNRTGAVGIDPLYLYSVENEVLNNKIVNTSISSNMLSIPIYASFTLPGVRGAISPKIYIGGDFSYYLSSMALNNYQISSGSNVIYSSVYESVGNRMKSIDYGAIIGTGFTIRGESLLYTFDLRYRYGINNLNNTTSDYVNNSLHQNFLILAFGIGFSL